MSFYEYVGNMHIHTPYSDGHSYHAEIADAAIHAGLDFIIVTDNNIWVDGVQGYYGNPENGHVLLLTGEEVHDQSQLPQANHALVYGVNREVAALAHHPQALIDTVNASQGLVFLAHPCDKPVKWHRDGEHNPWLDWNVHSYTGLEIWNYMVNFKLSLKSPWDGIKYLFRPEEGIIAPNPDVMALWDDLLAQGNKVVGIGGADADATPTKIGFIEHIVFPYDFLFSCINTHILTPTSLAGDTNHDSMLIYNALRQGRAFIGYDFIGQTKGFQFTAQGGKSGTRVQMGGSIRLDHGVTLQALSPERARIKVIYHGDVVVDESKSEKVTYVAREAGAYRVEIWKEYKNKERCWIISNPIYVEPNIGSITIN